MLSAEMFIQHAKREYKKVFNAFIELLLHWNSEQAQPVHPLSLIWIFSGLLLSIHVFLKYPLILSGQRSWSDLMMIKWWDIDVISSCLFQKNKERKKEYHVYPKHSNTLPYLPQKLNKVIYLSVYLSKIARWATFSNDSNHSAFYSGATLFAQTG